MDLRLLDFDLKCVKNLSFQSVLPKAVVFYARGKMQLISIFTKNTEKKY